MVQTYPFLVTLYKGEGQILTIPTAANVSGSSVVLEQYHKIVEMENAVAIGQSILGAIDEIRNSPLVPHQPDMAFWTKESKKCKSYKAFCKNYFCSIIKKFESGEYEVYSCERLTAQGGFGGSIKEIILTPTATAEEIGQAVIECFRAADEFYADPKNDPFKPKTGTIETLSGEVVSYEIPKDDRFTDAQDYGAAEIYQGYSFCLEEGAEPIAEMYFSIAAELDCDMSEEHIQAVWERLNGKADSFAVTKAEHPLFELRAEMRNKKVHRISYLKRVDETELFECAIEIQKPNTRKKRDQTLTNTFEKFVKKCKSNNGGAQSV